MTESPPIWTGSAKLGIPAAVQKQAAGDSEVQVQNSVSELTGISNWRLEMALPCQSAEIAVMQ